MIWISVAAMGLGTVAGLWWMSEPEATLQRAVWIWIVLTLGWIAVVWQGDRLDAIERAETCAAAGGQMVDEACVGPAGKPIG